jgi:YebC/PmpR family DNA-binding regulatory protein
MSGHSKWHSIKHQKAVTDARRGQLFTKLTREIIVAVRNGGPNPDNNVSLRLAIQRARDASMPSDNIERAIKRASGATEGANLVEMVLEGYGPGGSAILVEALSDNRNRTIQAVRNVFSRGGGSLGEAGCVAWQFEPKGIVAVQTDNEDTEELALRAIDAGAEDVTVESGVVEVYTRPEELEKVRAALEEGNIPVTSAELSMVPKATLELDEKAAMQTLRMMDKLEELDEVRRVSSNVDFSDEVLAKYQE